MKKVSPMERAWEMVENLVRRGIITDPDNILPVLKKGLPEKGTHLSIKFLQCSSSDPVLLAVRIVGKLLGRFLELDAPSWSLSAQREKLEAILKGLTQGKKDHEKFTYHKELYKAFRQMQAETISIEKGAEIYRQDSPPVPWGSLSPLYVDDPNPTLQTRGDRPSLTDAWVSMTGLLALGIASSEQQGDYGYNLDLDLE